MPTQIWSARVAYPVREDIRDVVRQMNSEPRLLHEFTSYFPAVPEHDGKKVWISAAHTSGMKEI